MQRDIYNILSDWKISNNRRPLLIRGARQTGKTYTINEFGNKEFVKLITLNFERNPEYKEIFSTMDPVEIMERITLYTREKIEAGKTLLFLDEIQECPDAILSLRYFYEEVPEQHVIGAGSLLEFALRSEKFRVPVGRIQYLFLHPLSFGEFLDAMGETDLRHHIRDHVNLEKLPIGLHDKLNDYIKKYFIIGGMPAVVKEYTESRNISTCSLIQRSVLDTYIDDFAKYARHTKHDYLRKVFNAVPGMIGQKFVYAHVDRDTKSRELREAQELLETAGVITRVRQTSGSGLPLATGVHDSIFKEIFLDVGLLHTISGIHSETAKARDYTAIFRGAVAEQFAGQELLACHSPFSRTGLYYWGRQARNSTAEVDYLIEQSGKIIPVEIKSAATGHLKSMLMFMEKYSSTLGYKISQAHYKKEGAIISLPLYAIESLFLRTN